MVQFHNKLVDFNQLNFCYNCLTIMFFRWFVLLTFVVALFSSEVEFKDCNFTDFRFQSKYNLGQQDELNKTFQLMKGKISVPDITYPINSYTNYSLTQIKTTDLQYLDARQKAEIMGNDTIVIAGGYLQTTSEMVWKRKDFLQRGGTLQTTCKSEQIMFSKNLTTERGFLLYKVMDYYNISFQSVECKITRYEPANTSSTDLDYINQLINKRTDNKQTLKLLLAEEINKRYFYYLNNSLYSERHQLDDHFTYEWKGPTKNLKIDYQVLPTGADLEKDGLSFTFVTEIKDDDKWQCGASIPHDNFDVRQYGGIQEFISLSLFKNTLRYGIEAGALDTVLNLQGWESRMFQFYAGDLYEAIPYISRTYLARQQITGNCTGSTQDLVITAEQKANEMTVKTTHNCQLFIKSTTKIVDIKVHLYSEVQAAFEQTGKVNFYIRGFTHNLSYIEQPSFKIQNYQLANALVLSCLKRLIGLKTFGSGWPTYQMDYPQLKVMSAGYVFLYDSSHIGSSQL